MKFFRAIFNLPFLLNFLIGIGLVIGLVFGLRAYLTNYTHHDEKIEIPDISKMKLFDALALLQQNGLKYEIDSFKFDEKHDPYTIFEVYPAIGTNVKEGRRIFLRANPKTWAPVAVPNLKDTYKNNAFRSLERLDLKVGDTIFEPHKYKDYVLRMMYNNRVIQPGTMVPRFSKIDLVIGKSLEKNVSMIDVRGLSLEDATHMLKEVYFEVGRVDDRDVLNKDSKDIHVFYQSPSPGEIFDQGESVILFMTDQSDEDLQARISELQGIYRKKISTDSAGSVNYNFEQEMGSNVSRDVKRQIKTNIDESTSRGDNKPKPNTTPSPQKPNSGGGDDGIVID